MLIQLQLLSSIRRLFFAFPALPLRGRRAEAHSSGGELSREADGAVMDIGAPSGRYASSMFGSVLFHRLS